MANGRSLSVAGSRLFWEQTEFAPQALVIALIRHFC